MGVKRLRSLGLPMVYLPIAQLEEPFPSKRIVASSNLARQARIKHFSDVSAFQAEEFGAVPNILSTDYGM